MNGKYIRLSKYEDRTKGKDKGAKRIEYRV